MKDMLKNYTLGALACIVMGAALIVDPHIITDVLNTAIGVILIVWAALGILRFIISQASDSSDDVGVFSLLGNIILLIAGIYVFINTSLLETVVMLALGIYLLCSGLPKLMSAFRIKRYGSDKWVTPMITSALTVLLGGFVISSPRLISGTFMRVIGVLLLIAGVTNFVSGFSASQTLRKLEREMEGGGKRGKKKKSRSSDTSEGSVIDIDDYEEE